MLTLQRIHSVGTCVNNNTIITYIFFDIWQLLAYSSNKLLSLQVTSSFKCHIHYKDRSVGNKIWLSDSNSAVCVLHLHLPRGISIVSTSRELFKVANGDTIRGLSHSLHKIQIHTEESIFDSMQTNSTDVWLSVVISVTTELEIFYSRTEFLFTRWIISPVINQQGQHWDATSVQIWTAILTEHWTTE